MSDRSISPVSVSVKAFVVPALISAMLVSGVQGGVAYAQEETPVTPATTTAAQTNGQLTVTVRDIDTKKPVSEAVIRIDGPAIPTSINVTSDAFGVAFFKELPAGTYQVYFQSKTHKSPKKNADDPIAEVTIEAGKNNTLTVEAKEVVIELVVDEASLIVKPSDTSNHTRRDRNFIREFPLTAGNQQNFSKLLRAMPGFVADSMNQIHPRGENSITTGIYLDGIQLPQSLAGRGSQYLLPGTMQSVTARVAGISPEQGGGSGAILDINLIQPKFEQPRGDVRLGIGQFNTREIVINYGGGIRRRNESFYRRLGYQLSINRRYTASQVEAPDGQTNFNDGTSEVFFGKVYAGLGVGREASILFNFATGRTNSARRDALSGQIGSGLGFTGTGAGNQPSQEDLGQRIRQKDNNNFLALKYRSLTRANELMVAVGVAQTQQGYFDVGSSTFNRTRQNLPGDSSIDYIPFVNNNRDQVFAQADFTPPAILNGVHKLKFGVSVQTFNGGDSIQLFPQSQRAVTALRRLDPRLVSVQPGDSTPFAGTDVSGYLLGVYAQDFFRLRNGLNVNFGFRLESYKQDITTKYSLNGQEFGLTGVNTTEFLPRLNLSWLLPGQKIKFFKSPTILRVSYNRMMATPAMGQGNFLPFSPADDNVPAGVRPAFAVDAQVVDQYDLSIERQLGRDKIIKLSLYSKDITKTLVTQQLIEGLQGGTTAVLNGGSGSVEGVELAFDWLAPRKDGKDLPGPYGYFVFASSTTGPRGQNQRNNFGQPFAQPFYDFDQESTLNLGVAYRFADKSHAGLSLYYGSGLFASASRLPGSPAPFQGRESTTVVDAQYVTAPRFLNKRMSLSLEIENLFDSRSRLNYRNDIAGTRFQMGRRIILAATGKF
jgi:hypothetical protein